MTFDFDGEQYARASAPQKDWGTAMIDDIGFRGNERVLDLGCGDGLLSAQLADEVPRGSVLGVDASPGMMASAHRHSRDNLSFMQMDVTQMDFYEEFDLICSNAALHWIRDHRELLCRVRRALKHGGRIRFNFAAEGNCPNFLIIVRSIMNRRPYSEYFECFEWPWFMPSIDHYNALMAGCRFADYRVWPQNDDRIFPNAAAMTGWLEQPSLVPFLAVLPDHLQASFRDEAVQDMIKRTARSDGACLEVFRRINVFARKA